MGGVVRVTVAEGAIAASRWHSGAARPRNPAGSAISPLLANLFLHYAFDAWMAREFPRVHFERYCDDIVVHGVSEKQTRDLGKRIAARLGEVGLRLHPEKPKVVYCPQDRRDDSSENRSFTFLGFTFAKRSARRTDGGVFNGFLPAVSKDAMKKMSRAVHRWRLHRWTTLSLNELAAWVNEIVPGWLNYYGRYYRTALLSLIRRINAYVLRWARKKYKRLRAFKQAVAWWNRVTQRAPELFKHVCAQGKQGDVEGRFVIRAVPVMEVGPPGSPCRRGVQRPRCHAGQKPGWEAITETAAQPRG